VKHFTGAVISVLLAALAGAAPALADTMETALTRAYLSNPQLNVRRERLALCAAESQVLRRLCEAYRILDQAVLLQAATSYMDHLRDSAIVEIQKSNVRVLEQTLKQTQDRFDAGQVTRTDVTQSEAGLAAGKMRELTTEANLAAARANFRRIIGNEPQHLAPAPG